VCWPTPEEAIELIARGYGNRLMMDWWVDYPADIFILCPAIVGSEGTRAPENPIGRCTFLTDDGKCEIYDVVRPVEARKAKHGERTQQAQLHQAVAVLWEGKESIVDEWVDSQRA
jgi:hypothetical protein